MKKSILPSSLLNDLKKLNPENILKVHVYIYQLLKQQENEKY